MAASDPTARFRELLSGAPEVLPLDEAMLLVAAHDHQVDVTAQLARLDALAERCRPATLEGLLASLFATEGFNGDVADYHHPDNSFLDRVMDRRRGLPILLAVLTSEIGCRVGVCLAPVGMPGHFLLRDCGDPDVFVDPFHGGRVLDRAACEAIFRSLHPQQEFRAEYLEPVDSRAVLQRVVTNLVRSYVERGPVRSLAWAMHLRALAATDDETRLGAWRSLGRLRERIGDWNGAALAYEQAAVDAPDDDELLARARTLVARMN